MLLFGSVVGAFFGLREREGRRPAPEPREVRGIVEVPPDRPETPRTHAPPPEDVPPPLPPEVEPPPTPPVVVPTKAAPPAKAAPPTKVAPPRPPAPTKITKGPPPRPPRPPAPAKVTKAPPPRPPPPPPAQGRNGTLQVTCSARCEIRVDGAPAAARASVRVSEGSHSVVVKDLATGASRTRRVFVPGGATISRRVGF